MTPMKMSKETNKQQQQQASNQNEELGKTN